jgi:multiple sugar transport system permease protein
MFTTIKLIDSLFGLILANVAVGVPFATWMMKGFFDTLPRELEQAAAMDGCSPLQALWYVILPLAKPAWRPADLPGDRRVERIRVRRERWSRNPGTGW